MIIYNYDLHEKLISIIIKLRKDLGKITFLFFYYFHFSQPIVKKLFSSLVSLTVLGT